MHDEYELSEYQVACLRAATDLIQGVNTTLTEAALRTRMRRIADDLVNASKGD